MGEFQLTTGTRRGRLPLPVEWPPVLKL